MRQALCHSRFRCPCATACLRKAAPSRVAHSCATPGQKLAAASVATGYEELFDWARQGGSRVGDVVPGTFKGVSGLKASKDIKQGEVVALVPRSLSIWTSTGAACPFPEWISAAYFKRAPLPLKLALMLVFEKQKGRDSKFAAYLATLPPAFNFPYFWSDAQIAALTCPHICSRVKEQQELWASWHADLVKESPACGVSKEQLDWALACVGSRAFKGPFVGSSLKDRLNLLLLISGATALSLTFGILPEEQIINAAVSALVFNVLYELLLSRQQEQYALCPLVDLANHSSAVNSDVEYEYFKDGFLAPAGQSFSRGSQVFISYGAQSTDALLQYYGFVEEANSGDVYTLVDVQQRLLKLSANGDVPANVGDRLQALELDRDSAVSTALQKIVITSKAQVTDEVKVALRYVLGLADSVSDAQEKQSNYVESTLWQTMQFLLEDELRVVSMPAREAERAMKDARKLGQERQELTFRYLLLKRKFLDVCAVQLKTRVSRMLA